MTEKKIFILDYFLENPFNGRKMWFKKLTFNFYKHISGLIEGVSEKNDLE